jgi:cell wall-associated NlpC family hydrolase
MPFPADLKPLDCLLYRPKGVFGRIISVKTWHNISHVEVYAGDGMSFASRDGIGVDLYPWRNTELAYVLRPTVPVDATKAFAYARSMKGTPYGWLDLLAFVGLNVDFKGIVCSAFATEIYRKGGWHIFPTDLANDVAPFEFITLINNGFLEIYPGLS